MAKITTNTPNGNITITPNGTGEVDISKVDIDGGTIDGTTIGGTTPAAGTFTTFTSTGITDGASSTALTIDSDGATTIDVSSTSDALRITQTGAGNALVVEDSANPDSTPFVIDTQGQIMIGQNTTTGAKVVIGGFTDNTFASSTGLGVYGNSHFENSLKVGTNLTLGGSLTAGTIGSGVIFPAGHIIQFAQSFTETGGGVIGNLSSVGSGSPSTILTATINNVLASSKVFGFFYTGNMVLNSAQNIYNNVSGGGGIDTDYLNQSGSGNGRLTSTFYFYDDAPGTGTNSYVLTGYSNASGNAAYWCSSGGYAYGWMLFEVAQ